MQLGLLTAPFGGESLENVVRFAREAGFDALEVAAGPGSGQLDPGTLDARRVAAIQDLLEQSGVAISSLAYYANVVDPDAERRRQVLAHLDRTIDAAAALGVPVVCILAGMPLPGQDRRQTITEALPGALRPALDRAGEKGIRLAFENWFATNIQNLEHWQLLFEVIPDAHLGLNFDPSHLVWQGIDHIAAVHEFAPRIFHTHAKDVEILEHRLRRAGNQAGGWWRYVIPGFGRIHWGQYLAALRSAGFQGAVSIEHEDGTFGREEGFVAGARYLRQFI